MSLFSSDNNKKQDGEDVEKPGLQETNCSSNRRLYDRFNVEWPVQVELVIQKDTSAPKMTGMVQNIGNGGFMLKLTGVKREMFSKMIKPRRYAKVHLDIQQPECKMDIIGKVIWVDYHEKDNPNPHCFVGVCFEKMFPAEEKQIENVLAQLEQMPDSNI